MKKFVYVENGNATSTLIPSDGADLEDGVCFFQIDSDIPDDEIFLRSYWKNGERRSRNERPSVYHEWDLSSESWLPNLDAARNAKLQEVAAELDKRLYLPCCGFDADKVSRGRISGMVARLQRGDGLPAGWMGWRDFSNQQQWAMDDAATVLANLTALSRAIEDREQVLLVACWTHKANIATLTDIDAIIGYDVTAGWPT
jgi:hypothetical protein